MSKNNKTFMIVRDLLVEAYVKQKIEVEAKNLEEAINIVRIIPENDLYSLYNIDSETHFETERIISSSIKPEECYQIPTQLKLPLHE